MRSTLFSALLIYGAQMQISLEMTELSKKTQFHVALFIAIFFCYFFLKTGGVATLWYFAPERNATVRSLPAT